jgi:ribonuclease HII
MDTRNQPLASLRARVETVESEGGLRRWSRQLSRDPRAGARRLGEQCARRARKRAAAKRHLVRLLAGRAALLARGVRNVAGVDEVGVGPLAGPVVAAAVVLPERVDLLGLDDSKQLRRAERERLALALREQCTGFGIGVVEVEEIDRLNVYHAALEAMRRAVAALREHCEPGHLLVDARTVPRVDVPQTAVIHGDATDASIAAASIVAKVHRDELMRRLDEHYAGYGFARHMGYGTAQHLRALRELGPTPIHRRSFAPVREALRA